MTYAESKKKKPFDWNAFLKQKSYTQGEVSNAGVLAGNWVTCACGNQCDIIPRNEDWDGEPTDKKLAALGSKFCDNISFLEDAVIYGENIKTPQKKAKETLKKIEARSSQLIKIEIDRIGKTLKNLGLKIVKS